MDEKKREEKQETAVRSPEAEAVWCAVANVVWERQYGPYGSLRRDGTKHFPPGAKVYAISFFWGIAGERVTVVGRHRGAHRYVTLVMRTDHLANWRAELVYSPFVAERVRAAGEYDRADPGGEEARQRAKEIVTLWQKAGATTQPFVTRPPSRPSSTGEAESPSL